MAETSEKKPTEAIDEPRLPSNEIGQTSDADMALAAMGYKPVRLNYPSYSFFFFSPAFSLSLGAYRDSV